MLYMYRPPYQGLEEVRQQFLDIKSKVAVCKAQDPTETSGGPRKSGSIFQVMIVIVAPINQRLASRQNHYRPPICWIPSRIEGHSFCEA